MLGTIIIEDLKSPKQALKIYKEIREKYRGDYLARKNLFLTAETLDRTTGTTEQVINAYKQANDYKGNHRIKEIRSFKSKKGFLKKKKEKKISLMEMADKGAAVIKKLNRGAPVHTMYPKEHQGIVWYKVKTADRTIGWVEENQVSFPVKHPVLLPGSSSSWWVFGADKARTRGIKGRPVTSPALKAWFQNIAEHEILFWDVNKDGVPDIVTTGFIDKAAPFTKYHRYHNRAVVVIDGKSGKISRKIPTPASLSSGTIHRGILYSSSREISSQKGMVYAFDVSAGTVKWKFNTDCSATVPVIDKETIYVGSAHGIIYALDVNSGSLKWEKNVKGHIDSAPVIKDNKIYCAVSMYWERPGDKKKGIIFCMDLASRDIVWKFETPFEYNLCPLSAAGNVLLCPCNNGILYALDMTTGSLKWSSYSSLKSVPAVKDKSIFIGTGKGVFALDVDSGKVVWKYAAEKSESFAMYPCIVGDVLYTASNSGYLYMLRLQDGKMMWKFNLGVPVVAVSSCGTEIAAVSETNFLYIIGE